MKYALGTTHKHRGKKVEIIKVHGEAIGFGKVITEDGNEYDVMFNKLMRWKDKKQLYISNE